MTEHFIGWAPGKRMHAHLGKCIKCGSPEGDTIVCARVSQEGLSLDGVGSVLCPACKAKYLPLTQVMDRELTMLGKKVWPTLKKLGCPCCEAGLDWQPSPQVH